MQRDSEKPTNSCWVVIFADERFSCMMYTARAVNVLVFWPLDGVSYAQKVCGEGVGWPCVTQRRASNGYATNARRVAAVALLVCREHSSRRG
jgi:hypothetical protein